MEESSTLPMKPWGYSTMQSELVEGQMCWVTSRYWVMGNVAKLKCATCPMNLVRNLQVSYRTERRYSHKQGRYRAFCSAFHLYAREKRGFVNYSGGFYENFSNTYFKYKLCKIENLEALQNSFTGMEIIFL
jgi:hypothetical protein